MPKTLNDFKKHFPEVWSAYEQLRNTCDNNGSLDRKTGELIKIAVSTALRQEGGVVAHASQAKKAGASDEEVYQAILVAMGQAGFPAVVGAMAAAKEYLEP